MANASTFVTGKEERAALYDGATKSSAKLILIKLRLIARKTFRCRKAVIIGIKHFIAEELVRTAMPLICP